MKTAKWYVHYQLKDTGNKLKFGPFNNCSMSINWILENRNENWIHISIKAKKLNKRRI